MRDPPSTLSAQEQLECQNRLRDHLAWASTRERGFHHEKQDEAIKNHEAKFSIAMDGTDQMINGFPHYWQTSKKDARVNGYTCTHR